MIADRAAIQKSHQQRRHALKRYGLTHHAYEVLLSQQNGVCAICGNYPANGKRLAVDHCHKSEKVRGLLCGKCNTGLGQFNEDPITLRVAVDYLERDTPNPERWPVPNRTQSFAARLRRAVTTRRQTFLGAATFAQVNARTFQQWVIGRRVPPEFTQRSVLERLRSLPRGTPADRKRRVAVVMP
jgi:hypothetical protein